MKKMISILFFCFLFSISYPQNISVDRPEREIIGMGSLGDTNIYLCRSRQKKELIYPLFYKMDSVAWQGRTFFHTQDFDAMTEGIYSGGAKVPLTGLTLKKKAGIKVKKSFSVKVGMMPTFGRYIGKKKPGRYKQVGYQVKIESEGGVCFDGYVYYYFQKQSFFKRFFKKHRLKKRFKRLPLISGKEGAEVIFKNDMIQEGGQVKENYYTFKLKEKK